MSSLKNSIQRRNHRERAQPSERAKWGLLEKPKDYKLRAADHRVKKQKIKALQQKARDRNEDEFYFGMVNSKSENGVKVSQRGTNKVLSADVVKLMKTQDAAYLRTTLQQTRRELVRLEQDLTTAEVARNAQHPTPTKANRSRVLYDRDGEAIQRDREERAPELSHDQDDEESESGEEKEDTSGDPRARVLNKKRRKLQTLQDRERDLAAALEEVEEQRARMNGSIGGTNKGGVKFKIRQRKR